MVKTISRRLAWTLCLLFALCGHTAVCSDRSDFNALVDDSIQTVRKIRAANEKDSRLYFLETQIGILTGLRDSSWFSSRPMEFNWLLRVSNRFMKSINLALTGKVARKSASEEENKLGWGRILRSEVGGWWWWAAFEECDKLNKSFRFRPYPAPQIEEYVAVVYMIAHIDFDLRMALTCEGIGSDEAFREAGRIVRLEVEKRARFPRSFLEFAQQHHPLFRELNPLARRERVRERVKTWLSANKVVDPWSGIAPDLRAGAFEGSGTPNL